MSKKNEPMFVIKRDGSQEKVLFDKITNRLNKLLYEMKNNDIDASLITQKICSRIFPGITTTELDNLSSQICMSMITENPDFGVLGSRIVISNHQKNTKENFLEIVEDLRNNRDIHNEISPLVSEELLDIAMKYETKINDIIKMERDYLIDFFGFKTLERAYLLKINKENKTQKIIERPQHLFMRVAIGIHGDDLYNIKKTYDRLSLKQYTHATPTLFNAGTPRPQMSSCFLSGTEDSVEGIFETITDCAKISKWAGGIGIHISNIRSKGSYIRKTAGISEGIIPMLKVYNDVARYINQSGKRNGSFAMYLEPSHPDIFDFLDAKKNHGSEEIRARDLFYALWIPDLFMERVDKNGEWHLMDPDVCPGLSDVYGEEYNKLYLKYVKEEKYTKKIKARELWDAIISSQIEVGVPYMLYKDACNKKSNQKNIGTIKSSNLCVSGDTMILTSNGYYPIKNLKDKHVDIWNGKEWSNIIVKQTGKNQKLIEICFSNGLNLKCTPYHKFYIQTKSYTSKKSISIIDAKDLKKGMKLIKYNLENVIDNKNNLKFAYTQGVFAGDGSYSVPSSEKKRCNFRKIFNSDFCNRHTTNVKIYNIEDDICKAECYSIRPIISLYGNKIKLLEYIDYDFKGSFIEKEDKITLSLPYELKDKFYVPINNSLDSKIRWLEGYLDTDGCIISLNGIKNIQYSSIDQKFMINILYLLQTIGIHSQIKIGKESMQKLLPNGKGCKSYYNTQKIYRSCIDSTGLIKLISLGFSPKRLDIGNTRLPHHKTNMYVKIENILDNDEYEDTFCFNEPKENKGIFNGILTGQCAEIVEFSGKDETAVCNLASICLPTILEYPINNNIEWINLLQNDQKNIVKYYFEGELKLFTKDDCIYCKLLKRLLKDSGFTYDEIDINQSDKYRLLSGIKEPFETVPQLFSILDKKVIYLGGYDDNWKILSPKINYNKLYEIAYELTVNLNKVIDKNYYPIEKTRVSNMRNRPIGIGVQGIADLFINLKLPFDSTDARKINKLLFETIYYGSMKSSYDLSLKDGSYSSFKDSPLSNGQFQFNLWDIDDSNLSGMWDWNTLREGIVKTGIRNSLLTALMPTASTSQIMGYNECFEPNTSNLYLRRTLAGEFTIVNKYLLKDLICLDMWNENTKNRLIFDNGSVQNIKNLPKFLKDIYKTVWEIPQKSLIEMSADRGPFICQSQSLNLFFSTPEYKKLTMAHLLGWKLGLKTGSYYIRSKPGSNAQKFGIDITIENKLREEDKNKLDEEEGCLNCGA